MLNIMFFVISFCACVQIVMALESVPRLYEYYTTGGIVSGLNADNENFTLNGRNITLYSGAVHYFRVPKQYWRDRLKKVRAAGLNAVETYVPWNLHEPEEGKYDFGNGGTDWEDFLNLSEFLTIAKEEDLFVLIRPGPFICAEWEFGGMPSWLLRKKGIKVRTSDPLFMSAVKQYYKALLPIIVEKQFTRDGPVIAVQVENEYWSVSVDHQIDVQYLKELKQSLTENGVVELLFMSDGISLVNENVLPGVLQTANFNVNAKKNLDLLKKKQPGKPIMSMEFWTGWFDHWSEKHHVRPGEDFESTYKEILSYPASVNMYMFFGGTNFGLLNGANVGDNLDYQPTTTSYDYDAPLSEIGDYTDKYDKVAELVSLYNNIKTYVPPRPKVSKRTSFPSVSVTHTLSFENFLCQAPYIVKNPKPISMELLPINSNSGQSYGYIVYRKSNINIDANSILKIEGNVHDTVMVLLNGKLVSKPLKSVNDFNGFGYWRLKDSTLNLNNSDLKNATLDLVVENWGRVNFANDLNVFNQKKGIWQGDILINDGVINDWEIIPLEFKKKWITSLNKWNLIEAYNHTGPAIYKSTINIDEPTDTFIDMSKWNKGIVAINGFIIGRYCLLGPQFTLFWPAPLQIKGANEIVIFEHFNGNNKVVFSPKHIFSDDELISKYIPPMGLDDLSDQIKII